MEKRKIENMFEKMLDKTEEGSIIEEKEQMFDMRQGKRLPKHGMRVRYGSDLSAKYEP